MGVGGCDDILTHARKGVDGRALLGRYFQGAALNMVVTHGTMVSRLSLKMGRRLGLVSDDLLFLEQAALLHDIGICRVYAPDIGLFGSHPYMMHGVCGREILEGEGLVRHALVCERHIGVGLTEDDIVAQGLPLPVRDMSPCGLAEEIVCFADLFFSKHPGVLEYMKPPEQVREQVSRYGATKLDIFDAWMARFGGVFGG